MALAVRPTFQGLIRVKFDGGVEFPVFEQHGAAGSKKSVVGQREECSGTDNRDEPVVSGGAPTGVRWKLDLVVF